MSLEAYPSTFDAPLAGAQDDKVLEILENARDRIADPQQWTKNSYIREISDHHVMVCAIGALMAADGVRSEPQNITAYLFREASAEVTEAMRLLDDKAATLYPDLMTGLINWHGPLEALNQGQLLRDGRQDKATDPRRLRVLEVYDAVIAERRYGESSWDPSVDSTFDIMLVPN